MNRESQRYELESMEADQEESRTSDYLSIDDAMAEFYTLIGENYSEPSFNCAVHDLVAGTTIACWWYDPDDEIGKVSYNTPTAVLGN